MRTFSKCIPNCIFFFSGFPTSPVLVQMERTELATPSRNAATETVPSLGPALRAMESAASVSNTKEN